MESRDTNGGRNGWPPDGGPLAGRPAGPVAIVVVEIHEAGPAHWWTTDDVLVVLDHRVEVPGPKEALLLAGHHLLQGTEHACDCGGHTSSVKL